MSKNWIRIRTTLAVLMSVGMLLCLSKTWAADGPKAETAAEIQKLLTQFGYVPGTISGVWDADTDHAIWLYLGIENQRDLVSGSGSPDEKYSNVLSYMRRKGAAETDVDKQSLFIPVGGPLIPGWAIMDSQSRLLAQNDDGLVRVWDLTDGRQVRAIQVPEIAAPHASSWGMTSDGKYLITANSAVRVVDIETGRGVRTFWSRINASGNAAQLSTIAVRPNSTEFIACDGSDVVVYDWAAGKAVASLGTYANVRWRDGNLISSFSFKAAMALAISSDGRYLATSGSEFGIRVYDLEKRKLLFNASGDAGAYYTELTFSGDGKEVFAQSSSLHLGKKAGVFRLDLKSRLISPLAIGSSPTFMPKFDGVYFSGWQHNEFGFFSIDDSGETITPVEADPYVQYDAISADGRVSVWTRSFPQDANGNTPSSITTIVRDGVSQPFDPTTRAVTTDSYIQHVELGGDKAASRVARSLSLRTGELIAGPSFPREPSDAVSDNYGELHLSADGTKYAMLGGPHVYDRKPGELPGLGDFRVFDAKSGARICASKERSNWWARDGNAGLADHVPERFEGGSHAWSDSLGLTFIWEKHGFAVVDSTCATLRHIDVAQATNYKWRVSPLLFQYNRFAKPHFSEGLAVSGDGRSVIAWRPEQAVQKIDPTTGKRLQVYRTELNGGRETTISAEDLVFFRKHPEYELVDRVITAPGTSKFLVFLDGGGSVSDNVDTGVLEMFDESDPKWQAAYEIDKFKGWAVDPGMLHLAIISNLGAVRIIEPSTGHVLANLSTDLSADGSAAAIRFSEDGNRLLVLGSDGYLRVYDAGGGTLLSSTLVFEDGEWLTLTPQGFFVASAHGADGLVIRLGGLKTASLGAAFQALYRPDLVAEALKGDPDGKVKDAAAKLDLAKVVGSGAAPLVAITSPSQGTAVDTDSVEVDAVVKDQGGGVGKIEWRVNGVTLGIDARGFDRLAASGDLGNGGGDTVGGGKTVTVRQPLSLDPGENQIEVVAYNAKGLIASVPAALTVKWDGASSSAPPKLYVLAVGVNEYWDSRLQLTYAASDARAIGEAFAKSGKELYQSVDVTTVLDTDVTVAHLDQVFSNLATKVKPRDVFVFFLAGHGKTQDGRYYFLPQDFRYEDESSIAKGGIDQDRFQQWFAKIKARKSVLLYDTCDSGSLTASNVAARGLEQVAALARMTRAMGRTVLSASTNDAPALEGYRDHGVFTYAVLDALGYADTNRDGLIEVTELAAAVDKMVPDISYAAFKLRQVPQMSIVGSDFALTNEVAVLTIATPPPSAVAAPSEAPIPDTPTHVVIAVAAVHELGDEASPIVTQLTPGTQVRLIESGSGGWAVVARQGQRLGYVKTSDLAKMQ
ncbi:caspase family protein [Mesorhizobium sp. URHB0026]